MFVNPELREQIAGAMQRAGLLEDPAPLAALRWIDTLLEAYRFVAPDEALPVVAELRAEAVTVPALALEKLRSRPVLFFLDAVGQYVDHQPELRGLAPDAEIAALAREYGLAAEDAFWALRVTLTGKDAAPPFALLFPLLGHDRILMRIGAVASRLLHGRGLDPIKYGPGGEPFAPIEARRP
jgi:hypothetical protein